MRALSVLFLVACSSSNVATLEHTPKTFSDAPLRIGPPRKGPYLNAEGDERGVDVHVRLDHLPEDIAAYVLRSRVWNEEWTDEDIAGALVPMGCDEGRTLRVVSRDAFDFQETDDAWLAVHLAPPEIERGKAYAVVGCLKSKENVLHPIGKGDGIVVAMTSSPTHLGMLSSPSGSIAWEAVEEGHQLVGYDATSDRRVVTEVLALHERTLPAVDIALEDGRILQAPRSQEYWQPEKRSYQPASALTAGDELFRENGRAERITLEIARNVGKLAARSWQTRRAPPFDGLRRRIIDLEHVGILERGQAMRAVVEAGAKDDNLRATPLDSCGELRIDRERTANEEIDVCNDAFTRSSRKPGDHRRELDGDSPGRGQQIASD